MSTLAVRPDSRVDDVRITDDWLEVLLKDGRKIAVPLGWYPRLRPPMIALRGSLARPAMAYTGLISTKT